MRNEWVDFRAVKASVSLAEVLRAYGVDWLRTRRPGQLEGRCPIHQGDRVDAFHVRVSQNAFHCFACQAGGNVLDFVAAMERCSVREAARRLAQRFPVSALQPGSVAGEKGNWLGKKEGDNRPLSFILRGVDRSHAYLRARGISPETAALFGVGFYAGPGVMSGRVVIPIHDPRGRLVAYAGRSLDGAPPKYRLPAGFRKSLLLFNFHRAAARDEQTVGGGRVLRLPEDPPGWFPLRGGADGNGAVGRGGNAAAGAIPQSHPDAGRGRSRPAGEPEDRRSTGGEMLGSAGLAARRKTARPTEPGRDPRPTAAGPG